MCFDFVSVATLFTSVGTLITAIFMYKQYKQMQSQFEHVRRESEKPVILDLMRYVIVPFLHEVIAEEQPYWPTFRALGEPAEWSNKEQAKLAFDLFKDRFLDAWTCVKKYDCCGRDLLNARELLKRRTYETLLRFKAKLEEFAQRKRLQLNADELAKRIVEYNYCFDLCYGGSSYSNFYEENPKIAKTLRGKLSNEIAEAKRRCQALIKAGRILKEKFESLQRELLNTYDIPVSACIAQLERLRSRVVVA